MSSLPPPTTMVPSRARLPRNPIWRSVLPTVREIRIKQIHDEGWRNVTERYEYLWNRSEKHDPETGIHLAIYNYVERHGSLSQDDILSQVAGATQDHLRELRNQGILYI